MDSSDERHPTEEQHRSAEQKHWDWKERIESSRDKIGRITLTLSVIAFGVACISLWQSYRQADAAQGQLEAMRIDARAWVAPVDAAFIEPVQSGKKISLSIKYRNFGREPAKNFFSNMLSVRQFTRANWLAETEATAFIQREKASCFATDPLVGLGIVWPSSGGEPINLSMDLSSASRPKEARFDFSQDVVDGDTILVFTDCFVYGKPGAGRHTPFCYYYDALVSDPSHLSICPWGTDRLARSAWTLLGTHSGVREGCRPDQHFYVVRALETRRNGHPNNLHFQTTSRGRGLAH